tara:strand:- start:599 stop:856 length:258 start_codon:yes stop_codon:yes gene_type:complete
MDTLLNGVPHKVVQLKSSGKPKTSNCWHVPTNVHSPKVLQSRINRSRVEAKAFKDKNGSCITLYKNHTGKSCGRTLEQILKSIGR